MTGSSAKNPVLSPSGWVADKVPGGPGMAGIERTIRRSGNETSLVKGRSATRSAGGRNEYWRDGSTHKLRCPSPGFATRGVVQRRQFAREGSKDSPPIPAGDDQRRAHQQRAGRLGHGVQLKRHVEQLVTRLNRLPAEILPLVAGHGQVAHRGDVVELHWARMPTPEVALGILLIGFGKLARGHADPVVASRIDYPLDLVADLGHDRNPVDFA